MMKAQTKKKPPKRCRHAFGPMVYELDEQKGYQVCQKCKRTRFEGDRNVF